MFQIIIYCIFFFFSQLKLCTGLLYIMEILFYSYIYLHILFYLIIFFIVQVTGLL